MDTETITKRDLYPIPEAMQRLGGISRSLFYELVARGAISTVRIGRRRFVTADEIERYIASLAGDVR